MGDLGIAAVTIDGEGGVNGHPIAPPDVADVFVEGLRVRAGELSYRHQHPICGLEPEVRTVERFQSALEMDTTDGGADIPGADRCQFPRDERFRALRCRRKKACVRHLSIIPNLSC